MSVLFCQHVCMWSCIYTYIHIDLLIYIYICILFKGRYLQLCIWCICTFFSCILTCKYVLMRLSPCATGRRYSGYSLLHCPVGARWSEWKQGSGLEKTAFGYSASRNPWKWYPPPKKNDLEVPRNGTIQKKPSVKKLVLVKWRKKGMKQNHRIHLHSISTSISLLETPAIFVVVLFRGPLLLSTKKTRCKKLWCLKPTTNWRLKNNIPQTPPVFLEIFQIYQFFLHRCFNWGWKFPGFSSCRGDCSDFWHPSGAFSPCNLVLGKAQMWDSGVVGKKGSPKPPPPKKNIGKNNWGTKKLYKEKVRTFWW